MEDVTGLHAFDHLDPVSALNVLPDEPSSPPEPVRPAPRAAAAKMGPPASRGRSLPPPPPPRGGPAGLSVPPPPPLRKSAAPPPPSFAVPVLAAPSQPAAAPRLSRAPAPSPSSPSWGHARAIAGRTRNVADDDLTQRVDISGLDERTRVSGDDDVEPTSVIHMGSHDASTTVEPLRAIDPNQQGAQGLMDLSATTVAASIDMDWDEDEEPATNMRDELPSGIPPRSTSSDFESVVHVAPHAPASFSPPANAASRSFAPPRPSQAPTHNPGEPSPFVLASRASMTSASMSAPAMAPAPTPSWEEDAATNYMAPRGSFDEIEENPFAEPPSKLRGTLPWLALAAVLAVGLAFGVRAMMAPPALATVTLVTQPADAEVSVDGRPLVGQASPFTIQGLSPQSEHTLIVRSEGYAEQTSSFKVEAGETKALTNVTLEEVRVDTGFALESQPAGAKVFIDGEARDIVTPARITDLAPGLHTVRLEGVDGFQPYETQVAVAAGQVLELPNAQLAAAPQAAGLVDEPTSAKAQGSVASSARAGGERKVSRAEEKRLERKERRAEKRAARAQAKADAAAARNARRAPVAAKPAAVAVAKPMPAPAAGAGGGTLRVNTRPWSQVFIDGRLVGNTPQLGIALKPGTHKLKLVSPDLGMTKQMSIKIEKGQTLTKVINLVE